LAVLYTAEMLEMCDVPGIGSWNHAVLSMNCQRNVNSILPTQLPHKFSYIVALLIHNHFESPNILFYLFFQVGTGFRVPTLILL
jgi:hypothetical protein